MGLLIKIKEKKMGGEVIIRQTKNYFILTDLAYFNYEIYILM